MNKKLGVTLISIFLLGASACCTSKDTEAPVAQQAARPEDGKATSGDSLISAMKSQEYIFSSKAKTSEADLKRIFINSELKEVKDLGGNQFLLRFNKNWSEKELNQLLNENQVAGTISQNLEYKIPSPKSMQKNQNNQLKK